MSEMLARNDSSEEASLQLHESGVVVLYLGRNTTGPVTLSLPRMESIARLLKQVREQRPAGLVITSEGSGGFCVGLDNKVKASFASPLEAETLALGGQELCHAIETLPFPTVAAIHGLCLAEGFEIALACTYRIMSKDVRTYVGLPHVRLGVLPAFGTLERLPRLLGLKKALDLVLAAKILKSGEAHAAQLVHEIVPAQALLEHAVKVASGAHTPKKHQTSIFNALLERSNFIKKKLHKRISDEIREHANGYAEASRAAMESIFIAHAQPMNWRSDRDAKEFGRLALANESKALLRIAELKDAACKLGNIANHEVEHVHAVVLGAGHMGAGIAAALSANECGVILKDVQDQQLRRGLQQIKKHVSAIPGLNEAEKSFVLNRIEITTKESANFGNTNIAIEAVQEDKAIKIKALAELCDLIPEEAIIATNTSSNSISSLSKGFKRPSRLVGMHFFFPVETHELVEVVMGAQTGNRAIAIACALAFKMGKCPIVVHDGPGYLVNRILNPYLREAFQLLEEGYSVADVDRCAEHFGFEMGPFRYLDENGLDVAARWMESIDIEHGEQLKSPNYCKLLVQVGRKGRKAGRGFYEYGRWGAKVAADLRSVLNISAPERSVGDQRQAIAERLVAILLNEAAKCFEAGIAGNPGLEAAEQIDLGLVLGGGFPASRGGPLYYLDTIGAGPLLDILKRLEVKHGSRFRAAKSIAQKAQNKTIFASN